jgi:hypothetical protein
VTIIRDKREQNLNLTLPAKKDSGQLLEDSFELPDLSAETQLAIRRAEGELARLGPNIMEKVQREIVQANKQAQSPQEQSHQRQKEMQKRLDDLQQRMHDREQKLQREISGEWTEI